MRPLGFSTGALAQGDFRAALALLIDSGVTTVELSALRARELPVLLDALETDAALAEALGHFGYVSVHAPSSYPAQDEAAIAGRLFEVVARRRRWPVILHPDAIVDLRAWEELAELLLIENMDRRKPTGKTGAELAEIFAQLPRAGLCFDIGHARQIDPSMTEARAILRDFGGRLRQLHMSDVNPESKHRPLSEPAIAAFQSVAALIPADAPLILETPLLAPPGTAETAGAPPPAGQRRADLRAELLRAAAAICPLS